MAADFSDGNKGGFSVECQHIVACANKCPGCVSWGENGFIAVGSGNSVVIAQDKRTSERKLESAIKTLNHHKGRVNCVTWLRDARNSAASETHYLLSGSTDKLLAVWECHMLNGSGITVELANILEGHSAAVTRLDGMLCFDPSALSNVLWILSAAVDSTLRVWRSSNSDDPKGVTLFQTIDLKPALALTVSLTLMNDNKPLIVCGQDNSRVSLYIQQTDINDSNACAEFSHAVTLHGHEDWVRGSDFAILRDGDILLATSSQDSFIRLWRISPKTESTTMESDLDVLKLKEVTFNSQSNGKTVTYVVMLEAVLSGHEGWVYSVRWGSEGLKRDALRLLSSSMDKSVIVWKIDDESQIWAEEARFGEVGGNTLGFYGAVFSPDGSQVIAHSYNGALHLWQEVETDEKSSRWKTGVTFSGHFGSVLDLSWEPKFGRFFVTTSSDQTTRLFGMWNTRNESSWHEIARPQVHGYDLQCISMIDSFRFISGADEKVLRVFEAPANFIQNFELLSGYKMQRAGLAPEGATVPALGLSNKAVFSDQGGAVKETPTSRGEQYIENQFRKFTLSQPPSEEHLLQNSLWPETHKLYWHVYGIFCVAANSSGTLVASAAKSATPQHSTIVLWDTQKWKEVSQLHGHTLTVTQMEFSHNGEFLLSVSRDRTWILHQISKNSDTGFSASIYSKSDKKTCHARIIWSASWSHDDKYFCTGSRDKKLMFWKVEKWENHHAAESSDGKLISRSLVTSLSDSVTAVSFAPRSLNFSSYLLAIGKESGTLELHVFAVVPAHDCKLLHRFNVHESHAATVKRLRWRPREVQDDANEHWIASCSADNIVKLFKITTT